MKTLLFTLLSMALMQLSAMDMLPGQAHDLANHNDEIARFEAFDQSVNRLYSSTQEAMSQGLLSMTCVTQANISLNGEGYVVITPSMMLTNPEPPMSRYSVNIVGPLEDTAFCDQVNDVLMVEVHDSETGNTCWGNALIEDKYDPVIDCSMDTIPCNTDLDSLNFEDLLGELSDNCTSTEDLEVSYSYLVEEYSCNPDFAGQMTVSWNVEDEQGNVSTCDQIVLFEKAPIDSVMFPADITLYCPDANTDTENTGEPTIFGEPIDHFCGFVTFVSDEVGPLCGDDRKIVRTFMVMDWCTNFMRIGTQDIFIQDSLPPVITCPDDFTVGTDDHACQGTFIIPEADVTDECSDDDAIEVSVTIPGVFGTFEPGEILTLDTGSFTLNYTATDVCNNSASCSTTLQIIDDEPPTLTCQPVQIGVGAGGTVEVGTGPFSDFYEDNCGNALLEIRRMDDFCGVPGNTEFGQYLTFCCEDIGEPVMVVVRVQDQNDNVLTCMTEVTVFDKVNPEARCADIEVSLDQNGMATIEPLDVDDGSTDNCEIETYELNETTFDCSDVGENTVVLTVTDTDGNSATCDAIVTVIDTADPIAVCQDITVQLDANGVVEIEVDQIDGGSSDNCDAPLISISDSIFTCEDAGSNMVTLTVTDPGGNSSTCVANVFVEDGNEPICVPQDITVELDENGSVSITADQVDGGSSDVCGEIVSRTVDPSDFNCGDTGVVEVVLTIEDNSGNSSSCTANVTVVDNIAPEAVCQNVSLSLDANGMAVLSTDDIDDGSFDNCGIVEMNLSETMFDCSDIGSGNMVTLTVEDGSGSISTCNANVTIVDDLPPVAQCNDLTLYLDDNGEVNTTAAEADNGSSDNCGVDDIILDPTDYDCTDIGANTAVLTVTDLAGNSSTCDLNVQVLDTISPIALCRDITVSLNANGVVSITSAQIDDGSTDNCDSDPVISVSPSSFDCDDIGDQDVILTVTDDSGNSSTCTAVVTVIDDTDPTALCLDITVSLDSDGTYNLMASEVDGGSGDGCGDVTITATPNEFNCSDLGDNPVTLVVTDSDGNSSTCVANVHVENNNQPIANCQDITVDIGANGTVSITPGQINDGSSVTCGALGLDLDQELFDCDDIGDNTVILTVDDGQGNTATCTATVTVEDNNAPVLTCPADTVVSCADGSTDPADYGDVSVTDECLLDLSSTVNIDLSACNIGSIERTFTAEDEAGNIVSCTQTIIFENNDPLTMADITCPPDITLDDCVVPDPEDIPNGFPEIDSANASCFDVTITFTDETVIDGSGARVERTFTIVDACQDGSTGVFECVQSFFNIDISDPDIACPDDVTVTATAENGCDSTFIDLPPATASDENGIMDISNDSPHAESDGADASGFYPVGTTTVTFVATDNCGNTSSCQTVITVVDSSNIEFTCTKQVFNLTDTIIEFTAADGFVTFDAEGCAIGDTANFEFSFTPDLADNEPMIITCDSLIDGQWSEQFDIYIFEPNGDTTVCFTGARVIDPDNICGTNPTGIVAGNVENESNAIPDFTGVILQGDQLYQTTVDPQMEYEFYNVEQFVDYQVVPFNNEDHRDEVSALDLVYIRRHLLGLEKFHSPYQYIAADVNNNNQVSAADLVEIQKLLLGYNSEFPNNTSWKFVDAEYEFENPEDPLSEDYPQFIQISELYQPVTDADFMAVKIGDVNYLNTGLGSEEIEWRAAPSTEVLRYSSQEWSEGDIVEIPVYSSVKEIEALQMGLDFHSGMLEFLDIESEQMEGFSEANMGLTEKENGTVKLIWVGDGLDQRDVDEPLFTLRFRAKRAGNSLNMLRISQEEFESIILRKDNTVVPLELGIKEYSTEFVLRQNTPNPFNSTTLISFTLPADEEVTVTFFNDQGELLHRMMIDGVRGENQVEVNKSDIGAMGVIFYQLESSIGRLTKKMTILE